MQIARQVLSRSFTLFCCTFLVYIYPHTCIDFFSVLLCLQSLNTSKLEQPYLISQQVKQVRRTFTVLSLHKRLLWGVLYRHYILVSLVLFCRKITLQAESFSGRKLGMEKNRQILGIYFYE